MENIISQIHEKLQEEMGLYRELLQVAQLERDILLSRDHSRLMDTSQDKLELCQRLAQRQQQRRELMARLAPEGRPAPLRLGEVIALLPPEHQPRFAATHRRLVELVQRLEHLNQENKGFVEEALDTVDHLLGILTGRGQGGCSYSRRGMPQQASGARLVAREV